MAISEYIKLCCVKKGDISIAELARRTGQASQNLSNKISRDNFKYSELQKIADALGADVKLQFIDRKTGEAII